MWQDSSPTPPYPSRRLHHKASRPGGAGGPAGNSLEAVVDLQGLGLSALGVAGGKVVAGAGCSLQQIVEAKGTMVEALVEACRREAAWNLRNMATLAGAGLACDGRSPLTTALLALGARAGLAGGGVSDREQLLDPR